MISGNLSAAPLDRMAKIATGLIVFMALAFPFLPRMPIYGAVLMPVVLLITWMFSVKGYTILDGRLIVHRPLWETKIELPPDTVFKREPDLKEGLMKTSGNGGLFGYTGGFKNRELGSFKAYATNWDHAVSVISRSQGMTLVISPDNSEIQLG